MELSSLPASGAALQSGSSEGPQQASSAGAQLAEQQRTLSENEEGSARGAGARATVTDVQTSVRDEERVDLAKAAAASRVNPEEQQRQQAPSSAEKAEELKVVWARVKGYPAWPAQIMDETAAAEWLKSVRPGKHKTLALMFFGTYEVCWSAASAVEPWHQGVEKGYMERQNRDKRLMPSIQQALQYLEGVVQPQWWWQLPDAASALDPMKPARSDEHCVSLPRLASGQKGESGRPGWQPKTEQHSPVAVSAVSAEGSVVKKRRLSAPDRKHKVASAQSPGSLDGRSNASRIGDEQGSLTSSAPTAPKRRSTGPSRLAQIPGAQAPLEACEGVALPKYDFTKRNLWPGHLARPKRLPKDDIPVCDCHPSLPTAGDPARTGSELGGAELPQATLMSLAWGRSTRVRAAAARDLGKANCGPDCVNRQSYVHCDPKTCPCGAQCSNKPFYLLPLPRLAVFHTGDRGWGVRAEETIPQGAFIVEYAGELLGKVEKQKRLDEQARRGVLDFYMMEHSPGVIIDARLKGNLARFINSSCEPNCEAQKWRDAGTNEARIGIFAKRDIQPGEELAYDYNFEHSGLAEQAGAYRCRCGAVKCRGTMDTNPDRLKDAFRRIEVFWDGDQKFYRGMVLGYRAEKGVHIIQYDDGQRLKENLLAVKHRWLPDDAALCLDGRAEECAADSVAPLPEYTASDDASAGRVPAAKRQRLRGDSKEEEVADRPASLACFTPPTSVGATPTRNSPSVLTTAVPATAFSWFGTAAAAPQQRSVTAGKRHGPCLLLSILQKQAVAATKRAALASAARPSLDTQPVVESGVALSGLLDSARLGSSNTLEQDVTQEARCRPETESGIADGRRSTSRCSKGQSEQKLGEVSGDQESSKHGPVDVGGPFRSAKSSADVGGSKAGYVRVSLQLQDGENGPISLRLNCSAHNA